jgi:hypothetical protein
VIELQKRANEFAKAEAKPLLLQIKFQQLRKRIGMPPNLSGSWAGSTKLRGDWVNGLGIVRGLKVGGNAGWRRRIARW